jgi:hypothetical protein
MKVTKRINIIFIFYDYKYVNYQPVYYQHVNTY